MNGYLENPPTNLDWYLSKLSEVLKLLEDVPHGDGIIITEGFVATTDKQHLHRNIFYEPEAFKPRFKEIVTAGHTWINLNAVGVLEGKLLVNLERVSRQIVEGCATSVNLSGPFNFVREIPGWSLDSVVELND